MLKKRLYFIESIFFIKKKETSPRPRTASSRFAYQWYVLLRQMPTNAALGHHFNTVVIIIIVVTIVMIIDIIIANMIIVKIDHVLSITVMVHDHPCISEF